MKKLPFGIWHPLQTKLYKKGHGGMFQQLNINLTHTNCLSLIAIPIKDGTIL